MAGNKNDDKYLTLQKMYESETDYRLNTNELAIIRLDGIAFGKLYYYFRRPYDEILHNTMRQTLQYLCENISGVLFGYRVSDEISLLVQFDEIAPLHDGRIQKIDSIAAAKTTFAFNKYLREAVDSLKPNPYSPRIGMRGALLVQQKCKSVDQFALDKYQKAIEIGGMFDCRCFNINPLHVNDYFEWRQELAYAHAKESNAKYLEKHPEVQDVFDSRPRDGRFGICCLKYKRLWICDTPRFKEKPKYIQHCLDGNGPFYEEMPIITQERNHIESVIPTI